MKSSFLAASERFGFSADQANRKQILENKRQTKPSRNALATASVFE
ncbi:MAG: hypothetical protein M3388_00460 [Acidobacteriota bacterium]|nr:hypothetical protein [Acidobacteriota bacterium]